jgi:hypothetical protein
MINFVFPESPFYKDVLDLTINPIIKHLYTNNYMISSTTQDKCINVHFFNENVYIGSVGRRGINVFLAHGIADKNWRNNIKPDLFDYCIVTGELWKNKFIEKGFSEDKIFIGGFPKVDNYFINTEKNRDKKNILWCPTHNMFPAHSQKISSYPFFEDYKHLIPSKYNFIKSEHPANSKGHVATLNKLIEADVVLADYSSMLYEAWILDKPVIFLDWLIRDWVLNNYKGSFEAHIYSNFIGYHFNSIDELINCLDIAIQNGIDDKTREFINGIYSPELKGCSGKVIAGFLTKINGENK